MNKLFKTIKAINKIGVCDKGYKGKIQKIYLKDEQFFLKLINEKNEIHTNDFYSLAQNFENQNLWLEFQQLEYQLKPYINTMRENGFYFKVNHKALIYTKRQPD